MKYYIRLFVFVGTVLVLFNTCFKSKEQIAKDKNMAVKLINSADKLFFENKYAVALPIYLKSVDVYDFKNGMVYYKIGFCYDKGEKNFNLAKKYYKKSLEYLTSNLKQSNVKYLAADYFNLGILALKNGEIDKKDEYFSKAIPILKKILAAGFADGIDLFRIGYYYFDLQNYDMAIKYFLQSAKVLKKENPFHFYYSGAYFNIGIIYWKNEDINTALYYWKRALKIDPNNKLYKEWYDKALLIKKASN